MDAEIQDFRIEFPAPSSLLHTDAGEKKSLASINLCILLSSLASSDLMNDAGVGVGDLRTNHLSPNISPLTIHGNFIPKMRLLIRDRRVDSCVVFSLLLKKKRVERMDTE